MLETIRDDPQGQCLGPCTHLLDRRAVREDSRQARNLSNPASVRFLLDLRLPDCDDLRLLADIRRAAPASAVVMMTAHATAESAADARALGAYAVITKPFDLNSIEALLVDACQARLH